MKFENGGFNEDVERSEQAIESLDQTLENLSDNKSLEDLGDQTEEVSIKFDALRVAVETAIFRIVNTVIDGVSTISRKLNEVTIDPIMQGYGKYEEKINAVQTIMNATGLTIDQVEEKLEKLSWFTDETSYKYSDMVSSLSKFTSAGVGLDDAVTDMIGIATWAGTAGVNAQEATRAYYNLSQAIGSGVIMNKDWVSIEGLNMNNVEAMQTFIDVAKEFVTYGEEYSDLIDKYGANSTVFAETVKKNGHTMEEVMKYIDYFQSGVSPKDVAWEDFTTTGFRDTLAGKWFTSDIFNEAMRRYGDFSEQLKAFEDAGGYDTASEALRDYNDAFSGLIDTIYESYTEFGRNSEEFRKTLEDNGISLQTAMDFVSVKEARIFNEHLVELSETFKKTADEFGFESKEFAKAANEAGYSVEEAADIVTNGIEKYRKAEQSLGQKGFEASYEARSFSDAWGAAIEGVSSQWSRFWQNIIGNYEEAKDIWTKVSEVLWDVFAGPVSIINDTIEAVIDAGGRLNIVDGIKNIWNALNTVLEPIKQAISDVFSFFRPDGNDNYVNAAEYIYALTEAFRQWTETLMPTEKRLYELRAIAQGIVSAFGLVFDVVSNVIQNIGRVIRALLPNFGKIISEISKFFSQLGNARSLSDSITNSITNFTNQVILHILQARVIITVVIEAIKEKIQQTFDTIKVMYLIFIGEFEKALETNSDIVNELHQNGVYKKILKLKEVFDRASEAFTVFSENIQNKVLPIIEKVKQKIPEIVSKLITVATDIGSIGWFIFDVISSIVTSAAELFGVLILGPAEAAEGLTPLNTIAAILQGLGPIIEAITGMIKNLIIGIGEFVKNINIWKAAGLLLIEGLINGSISIEKVFEDVTWDLSNFLKGLGVPVDGIKNIFGGIKKAVEGMFEAFAETSWLEATADMVRSFAWSLLILAGSALILSTLDYAKLASSFSVISLFLWEMYSAVTALVTLMEKMESTKTISYLPFLNIPLTPLFNITLAIIGFASAIFILSAAVLNLGKTFNKYGPEAFGAAVGSLTVGMYGMVGAITGLMTAIQPIAKTTTGGKLAIELLGIANLLGSFAVSFLLMSVAVKVLGSTDLPSLAKGLGGIFVLLLEIIGFTRFIKLGASTIAELVGIAGSMILFALAINMLVLPIELMGHMKLEDIGTGLAAIAVLLIYFIGTVYYLDKYKLGDNVLKIVALSGALVIFALGLNLLTLPVTIMGSMKLEQIGKGLLGIAAMLAFFIGTVFYINKYKLTKGTADIILLATSLMIFALAIDTLTLAVVVLGSMEFTDMIDGLIGIAGMLAILGTFVWAINTVIGGVPGKIISLSLGILAISAAIGILALSLISIAKLDPMQQISGLLGILGLFTVVSLFLLAIKAIDPVGFEFIKISVGLIALSVGIMLMTQALKMMTEISLLEIGAGLLKIALILAAIAIVSALLSGAAPAMITFGISVGVVGAGLFLLGIGIDAMHTAIENIVNDPNVQKFADDIISGIKTALDNLQPVMEGMAKAWQEMWTEISKAWTDFWALVTGQKEEANNPDNYDKLAGEINPITGQRVLPPSEVTEDEKRKWAKTSYEAGKYAGKYADQGYADGVSENSFIMTKRTEEVTQDASDVANKVLGINSPSKVFYEKGKMTTLGFAEGIKDAGANKEVLKNADDVIDNTKKSVDKQLSDVSDIDKEIDSIISDVEKEASENSDFDFKQNLVDSLLGGIDDSKLLNDEQKAWVKDKVNGIIDGLDIDGLAGDKFKDIKDQIKGVINFDDIEIPQIENPFDTGGKDGEGWKLPELELPDTSGINLDFSNLTGTTNNLSDSIAGLNENLTNTGDLANSISLSDIFGTSDLATKAEAEGAAIGDGIKTGITDSTRKLTYNDIIHRNAIMRAAQKDGIWSESFDKALKAAGYTDDFYSTADRLKIYNEARATRTANFNDRINIKDSAELYRLITTLNNNGVMSDEFENALRSYYGDDYKELTAKEKNDLVASLTDAYAKEEEFIANNYEAILKAYESGTGTAAFKEMFNLQGSDDRDLKDFIDRTKAYKNYQDRLQNESEKQGKDIKTMSEVVTAFNQVIDSDGVKVTMARAKADVLENALKVIDSATQKDGVKKNSLEYIQALQALNWSYEDAEAYYKLRAEVKDEESAKKVASYVHSSVSGVLDNKNGTKSSTSETKANTTSTYNPVTTVKADNVTVDAKNTTATAQTSTQVAGDITGYIKEGVQKLTNIDATITLMNTKIDQMAETIVFMNETALNELALLNGWKGEVGAHNAAVEVRLAGIQNKGVPIANRMTFMNEVANSVDNILGDKAARRVRGN